MQPFGVSGYHPFYSPETYFPRFAIPLSAFPRYAPPIKARAGQANDDNFYSELISSWLASVPGGLWLYSRNRIHSRPETAALCETQSL